MNAELLYELSGHTVTLAINRPDRRNAINEAVVAGLREGLARAADEPAARVVVITGAGDKAFCAGADLAGGTERFGPDPSQPTMPYGDLLRAARACPLPLVARVNGACLAGGMGLMAMCDLAVAADNAVFGLPEVKVGVFPMQVAAVLMPLIAPRDLAELCFTGDPVDAHVASRMRLVNHVVPAGELDARVAALADRVAANSPAALRRGRHALGAASGMSFEQALAFLEAQIGLVAMTQDAREGIAAFAEKRAPRWTGR